MKKFNDIYYRVDKKIVEQGFELVNIDGKKELVDRELKNYLLEKIAKEGHPEVLTSQNKDNVSNYDLMGVLAEKIPQEEHDDTLRHIVHYVLNIAGALQGHSIVWWSSEDQDKDLPEAKFNNLGQWDSITTNPKEAYVKTFNFAYDIFQNQFLKTKNNNKVYVLTPNGLSINGTPVTSGEAK